LFFGDRDISQQPLNGNANAPSLAPICGVKPLAARSCLILPSLCAACNSEQTYLQEQAFAGRG